MTPEELKKDPYPFVMWHYANLQNLTSGDEGKRAANIMRLNEEFPRSFRGISVTSDSDFYRAGIHGKDEAKIKKAVQDKSGLDEAYAHAQLLELLDDANFTLENRGKNRGGYYYFPARNEDEKAEWQKACGNIVLAAFDAVKKHTNPVNDTDRWQQKAAFRELVLMGIIKHSQEIAAEKIALGQGKMMVTNACKENIDRGGKTNACFLWGLGGKEDDVFAAFHARALLSRFRLVLPDRVEPMYALTKVLPQKVVQKFLRGVHLAQS